MNEVSIIINGVRYDTVQIEKEYEDPCCADVCDLGHICLMGDTCFCMALDLELNQIFKKQTT